MRSIKIISAIIIVILFSTEVHAQAEKKLTQQQAIELALANSNQLKFATAKIREAEAAVKEARDMRLPSAGISGSHIRLNSPNIDLKTKPSNSGSDNGTGKISSATYGILNASLPIYAGSSIKYAIESSRYLAEAARLDNINDREGIALNAISAFNNLYKSKAAVELVKENLESAHERIRQFSGFEKNGLIARNDLLKAQLQSSNTELSLMDAENNFKLATLNMNLMLGLPDSTVIIPDISSFTIPENVSGMDEMVQNALTNRKDINSMELKTKAAETDVKYARSGKYPSLSLTGGYIALNVPGFMSVTNAVNIGIGVQYNLASLWKNNAKVEKAKARQLQVSATENILNDNIKSEVQEAYYNFMLAKKKIDTYRQALAQAEEAYKIVKNKYNNSLANTTDLLDADVAQLQARLDFAFSQADASTAYSKLLKASGGLLK